MKHSRDRSRQTFADIEREVAADIANGPHGIPIVVEQPSPTENDIWLDEVGVRWRIVGDLDVRRLNRLMSDPEARVIIWRRPFGRIEEVPPAERQATYVEVAANMAPEEDSWCGYQAFEFKDENRRVLVVIEG